MITKTARSLHTQNAYPEQNPAVSKWQTSLAEAIRDPLELLEQLDLPLSLAEKIQQQPAFPLRVTQSFLQRMQRGNLHDPLLRQVLPLASESDFEDWGSQDPVADHAAMQSPGLLHKYAGRVLLVSTAACAIHCRYCFRQHFAYRQANPLGNQWPATLSYLGAHRDIHEIILSGGDPLSLNDERLSNIVHQLEQLDHIRTLRIHTRLPVVLPERIDNQLLEWVTNSRLNIVFVLHINHPNEINGELHSALRHLQRPGITLLNQSVLLKGVNDNSETLIALSHKLFASGVLPYYLHQLDKVRGAAHFEVSESEGRDLLRVISGALPGYLVPKYVKEIPGEAAKSPILR
ncbi:MAG: EF-P beta-lysylation protein EpmB [Thioalkalispiraceae bacterium]|jgi:EF-P beta-lysylation protein EpmB